MNANTYLIGVPGSRQSLDTPALALDLPALKRNIARMAELAASRGIALRPHAKSHKSVEIARAQIKAGAIGVSCATLGEAEVMVEAAIPGVLITSPVVGANKIRRLIELARKAGPGQLMVVADHPLNVEALAAQAAERLEELKRFPEHGMRTANANAANANGRPMRPFVVVSQALRPSFPHENPRHRPWLARHRLRRH